MNKHFEDTRYYLKRAGETASQGVREELEPLRERVMDLTGRGGEEEPATTRVDAVIEDLKALEAKAEGEAREAIGTARERLRAYRAEASD